MMREQRQTTMAKQFQLSINICFSMFTFILIIQYVLSAYCVVAYIQMYYQNREIYLNRSLLLQLFGLHCPFAFITRLAMSNFNEKKVLEKAFILLVTFFHCIGPVCMFVCTSIICAVIRFESEKNIMKLTTTVSQFENFCRR